MEKHEFSNKIYAANSIMQVNQASNAVGSYYKIDRLNLLDKHVAGELNTYRNWKQFDLMFPKVWDDEGKLKNLHQEQGVGVKSLFSNVAGVYGHKGEGRKLLNAPLLDDPVVRDDIRTRTNCSIKALVDASAQGKMGRAIYNYSDFMYCKYLGKIPNNYLITLRKFPLPCGDHINFVCDDEASINKHLPDMGRLVTWLGTPENDLSNILTYTTTIPWQANTAPLDEQVHAVGGNAGGGGMGQILSALDGTYARELNATGGYGYAGSDNVVMNMFGKNEHGLEANVDLNNKNRTVSSRQSAIMKVMVPGGKDEGLDFKQDIKLTFDYQLRSYDGINGKSAMLDLLGNILMVTYMQGHFFKGSYRGTGQSQSNLFANLDIFKNKEATKSPGAFMNSMFTSVKEVATKLGFTGEKGSTKEALKKLGNNLFEMLANGMLNKMGRPQMFAASSMITPTPTGNWHLTIGNPRNPILSIGNLILKESTITHYGPLGLDDFPTGLKVSVTLEHAKPRDSVGIEQMYMQGDYRIYTPMDEKIATMYDDGKEYNQSSKLNTSVTNYVKASKSTDWSAKDYQTSAYMKYFGTRDIQSIILTAEEAMVGAEKTSPSKENKTK